MNDHRIQAAIVGNYRIKQTASGLYTATQPALAAERVGLLQSEYFDIILAAGGNEYRACKVQFRLHNGALAVYVHLLHSFGQNFGQLKRAELTGPAGGPEQINLIDGGKTTTRLVKFNHPADGRAHFSGMDMTPLFTQSTRLSEVNGHLFVLNYWDLTGFEVAGRTRSGRQRMTIDVDDNHADASQLAGRLSAWCYHRSVIPRLGEFELSADPNRPSKWVLSEGDVREVLIMAPNINASDDDDVVVFLAHFPGDIASGNGFRTLTFAGGREGPRGQRELDAHLTLLLLRYSGEDDDFEESVRRAGSLDFDPAVAGTEENSNIPNLHTH